MDKKTIGLSKHATHVSCTVLGDGKRTIGFLEKYCLKHATHVSCTVLGDGKRTIGFLEKSCIYDSPNKTGAPNGQKLVYVRY